MAKLLGYGFGCRGCEAQLSHLPGMGLGASDFTFLSRSFLSWKKDDRGNHPLGLFLRLNQGNAYKHRGQDAPYVAPVLIHCSYFI